MSTCQTILNSYQTLLTAKHTFDASLLSAKIKKANPDVKSGSQPDRWDKQSITQSSKAFQALEAAYTHLKAIEELKEIFLSTKFTVPNAVNHYRQALLDAGLPDGSEETKEEKEVNIDLLEEINNQLTIYAEAKDESGKPILQEWIDDISNNKDILKTIIRKDRQNIIDRLKAGMIPLVMPSQSVQLRTWEKALNCLKPLWIKNQTIETVNNPFIYPKIASEKMNTIHFFRDIPDHPYIVWTEPTKDPKPDTLYDIQKFTYTQQYSQQQAKYAAMVEEHPALYSPKDIIPTEYFVLQTISTRQIRNTYQKAKGNNAIPNVLKPLDCKCRICFLEAGELSDQSIATVCFASSDGTRHVYFTDVDIDEVVGTGFRPVARSI